MSADKPRHVHRKDHYVIHRHDGDPSDGSERALWWAVIANVALTFVQVAGGLISGSLSLLADALHNFSDAASLLIALIAIRIGKLPADDSKTFGYKRAETIAALINLTCLVMIGIFLMIEAVQRFFSPVEVEGWTIVYVAGFALAVDLFTAFLTFIRSKDSMNMRAVFLHNLTDALASVGVILTGSVILLYGWVWTDAVMTLMISAYVLWHGFHSIPAVIDLLMEGTPKHLNLDDIIAAMEAMDGVEDVHHMHVWAINEQRSAMETHVLLEPGANMDAVKVALKKMLEDKFQIDHCCLEFENTPCH